MPLSALIALFLASWPESAGDGSPLAREGLETRLAEALGVMAAVSGAAVVFGRLMAWRVARDGAPSPGVRRALHWGGRALDALVLVAFGAILHGLGWPRVVRGLLGDADPVLIGEALLLAPYLLMQLGLWWGLHAAERALRPMRTPGAGRHLVLNARRAWGLVLPLAVVFALGQDLLTRWRPDLAASPEFQVGATVGLAAVVLVLSPALVRLAWPSRPLPPGPLRDRLEALARRCGFRCTQILVWDTGMAVINAGVTGATPLFRYVLLSDALIAHLDEREVEAVFGHEIGHVAHRHLRDIALFFLGSLGVIALAGGAIDRLGLEEVPRLSLSAAGLILYVLLVFGAVSRRLERQSDLYGARAVSCGRPDCPPHQDPDDGVGVGLAELCPVGIRIFANALASVASLNGTARTARSWRHGSIGSRIAFLEGLEGHPGADRRFQARLRLGRLGLALLLGASLLLAWRSGALEAAALGTSDAKAAAAPASRPGRPGT